VLTWQALHIMPYSAARMESRGEPGRLHVAETAAEILRKTGIFRLTERGEIEVKGKGTMRTYFVDVLDADTVEAGVPFSLFRLT